MALVSPGIQISVNDQSQYVNSSVGSVPLVVLATAQDKTYNNAIAAGTTKANAGKLLSFTSQRDLVTAMGTPKFQLSSAGTPINGSELNEYGLMTAYSALGLGNRLFAIRVDIDLNELVGTSVRPVGKEADGAFWLDIANTEFGLYALTNNSSSATNNFTHISPLLITDKAQVFLDTNGIAVPKASVGAIGSYAFVFTDTAGMPQTAARLFYKAPTLSIGSIGNTWVQVGSTDWQNAVPTVKGVSSPANLNASTSSTIYINTLDVTIGTTATVADLANAINNRNITGVKAAVSTTGQLTLFVTSAALNGRAILIDDATNSPLYRCGIVSTSGGATETVYSPYLHYGSYASEPTGGWLTADSQPRPTGSIWWKTTSTGGGWNPVFKTYSLASDTWVSETAPMYAYPRNAIYGLDPASGGLNIAHGQVVALFAAPDAFSANGLRFVEQRAATQTVGTGTTPDFSNTGAVVGNQFTIAYTLPGTDGLSPINVPSVSITLTADPQAGVATASSFVADILRANIPNVTARLNSNGTISIIHATGGALTITDTNGAVRKAGFVAGIDQSVLVAGNTVSISNFIGINKKINFTTYTPYATPADGALWYYSNAADLDIMINKGGADGWQGYRMVTSDSRGYDLSQTDPAGVIVSASQPMDGDRSDAGNLTSGDLWLDSSDLANFPSLHRYNGTAWVVIDKADQTSSNGIVFADARWDTDGTTDVVSGTLPSIASLLTSSYIDLDAPDFRLYPKGTLLFNTRRSGYNVKKFVSNYFNADSFPPANSLNDPANYPTSTPAVTDAWVSVSGNREDGSMYAGSDAQRALIVAAMKSAVDSNTDALDANYAFNLLVAPGYPELIPNLVTLNDNRTDTGFVIGDTPMDLAPTSTALSAWNSNANGDGLATASPYLAVYYPAGLTNDLAGNSVVVPASHAVLRTFLFNDNVSYQWFAPAGVHRGLVDNLSDIGYINSATGEFVHNGVNHGLRDTLYSMNINPITQLPGTGLVVWGQETRSGDSTARNRVNVVRLENYLRTIFNTIANSFLFEPNDTITRKTLASQIESACHDLLSKRGLYDFLVICDTSNNTPSIIANNQLYVDVAIEPMKDVEFIYIPIALYNPGTIANLGAAST